MSLELYKEVLRWSKELVAAQIASERACQSLRDAPLSASRQKRTTLNARWSRSAEHRDKIVHEVHCAIVRAGIAGKFDDDYYDTHASGHNWNQIKIVRKRP